MAIAHEARQLPSYEAVCDAVGVDRDAHQCGLEISWDRPHRRAPGPHGDRRRGRRPGEPANPLRLWPLLPTGDEHKLCIEDGGAQHTIFEGSTVACEKKQAPPKCEAMRQAIFATGLAFVEAHLRDDARAQAWLASGDLVTAGDGVFTFEHQVRERGRAGP